MGIYCMAQEAEIGTLYQPKGMGWGGRWEKSSKRRRYMYTYGCFIGEGNGTPFQYSCLENPMDRGAW